MEIIMVPPYLKTCRLTVAKTKGEVGRIYFPRAVTGAGHKHLESNGNLEVNVLVSILEMNGNTSQ